jgi:hypothetical protein
MSNDEAPAKSTRASPFRAGPPLSNLFVYSQSPAASSTLLYSRRAHTALSTRDLPPPLQPPQRFHAQFRSENTPSSPPRDIPLSNSTYSPQTHERTMSASASRKRKSPEPERDAFNQDQVTTPSNSPARKRLKITQHQKQTLIDNLQLESASSFIL